MVHPLLLARQELKFDRFKVYFRLIKEQGPLKLVPPSHLSCDPTLRTEQMSFCHTTQQRCIPWCSAPLTAHTKSGFGDC